MTAIHYPVSLDKTEDFTEFQKGILCHNHLIHKRPEIAGIFPVRAGCGFADGVSEKFFPHGGIYRAVYRGLRAGGIVLMRKGLPCGKAII